MKPALTLFGCRLWHHIPAKTARKYMGNKSMLAFHKNATKQMHGQKSFAEMSVGDFVNDCDGYNTQISKIEPKYKSVEGGFILTNIIIYTLNNKEFPINHCTWALPTPKNDDEQKINCEIKKKMISKNYENYFC